MPHSAPARVVLLAAAAATAGCRLERAARPPTAEELGDLAYAVDGLEEGDSVRLTNGRFRGSNGTITGVEVYLLDADLRVLTDSSRILTADLEGDGTREAVTIVHASLGGTGRFYQLAVVGRRDGRVAELASAALGDRVEVRSVDAVAESTVAASDEPQLRVSLIGHGPGDPGCCPSHPMVYRYRFVRQRPGGAGELRLVADSTGPPEAPSGRGTGHEERATSVPSVGALGAVPSAALSSRAVHSVPGAFRARPAGARPKGELQILRGVHPERSEWALDDRRRSG